MDLIIVAIAIFVLLCIAFLPTYFAGLLVSGWYIYSAYLPLVLPNGYGYIALIVCLGGACVSAFIRRGKNQINIKPFLLYGLAFSVPILIFIRELFDIDATHVTWRNVAGFVLIGLLLSFFAGNRLFSEQVLIGFMVPVFIFGLTEIFRIILGGRLHSAQVSFGANPIFVGHFFAIALLAIFSLMLTGRVWKVLGIGLILFFTGVLILLASIGPALGLILGVILILLFADNDGTKFLAGAQRLFLYLGILFACLVIALVLVIRDGTNLFSNTILRLELYFKSFEVISEYPFFGAGTNLLFENTELDVSTPGASPHNIFLEIWAYQGFIPLAALVAVLYLMFRMTNVYGNAILVVGIVGFSVSGSSSASLNFWVAIAMALIVTTLTGGEKQDFNNTDLQVGPSRENTLHALRYMNKSKT